MNKNYYFKKYASGSKHLYKVINDKSSKLIYCSVGNCTKACEIGAKYSRSHDDEIYLNSTEILLYTDSKGE